MIIYLIKLIKVRNMWIIKMNMKICHLLYMKCIIYY